MPPLPDGQGLRGYDMDIISGESIKNAAVNKVIECLPGVNVYKEVTSTPEFPHCVVHQLSMQCEEERDGYFLLTYNMQIRYTHSYDLSTESRLQQILDNVALTLMANFDLLEMGDGYIRCSEKSYEKVEGVLLFSFDVQILANARDMDASEIEKMGKLIYTIVIEKE